MARNIKCPQTASNCQNINMRFVLILAFIACLVAVATAINCPMGCKRNYQPVCGMKLVKGLWRTKTFANDCEMRNENECNKGRYIPCPIAEEEE